MTGPSTGARHAADLVAALDAVGPQLDVLDDWGTAAARLLLRGGRLLAVGNGGSAAEAQHLTAELVGRYRDERIPLSAIALHADTSSLTAIANDYGVEEMFARQVRAHGRAGDVLVCLSVSGRSPNVVRAAEAARAADLEVWGLTGPAPNPLLERCTSGIAVPAASTATVQEVHLMAIHALCARIDACIDAPVVSVASS